MIPLVVIKCRHRANTPFSFTQYVFKKLNVICIINVKVFIQIMKSPGGVRLSNSGVYGENVLFYLGLFSFIIFLKHVNLTLVCYGRSIEVRKKKGKLLLERRKGGCDRLIEVVGQVFSFLQANYFGTLITQQRLPPKYIGIVF